MTIYTIGHSTHEINEFVDILKSFEIQVLVDVRSIPGSKFAPQFNEENLAKSLKKHKIEYLRMPKLGGRRKSNQKGDYELVAGWKNESFKNYAAYTLTSEYEEGIEELVNLAKDKKVCIMCSESVPWRCHRLLIANTLASKGIEVYHIMGLDKSIKHKLNKYGAYAKVQDSKVIYPEEK